MVRTRFAPSPTGFLHVGGGRTALFAWLLARQAKGQFILRIEDTDRSRHIEEAERQITDSLKWLGLDWEAVYRQSDRLDIYKEWGQKLLEKSRAYADPTPEEKLSQLRDAAKSSKRPFLYRENRPTNPPKWNGTMPLRFMSEPKNYKWHDEVMGELSSGPEVVDDFILIKADGFPTYNFAHIVDDHLMQISHVIRTQEFLPSVPKFLNLYEALEIEKPKLATLPYVLNPSGNKKLSKRDGAKDILDYKQEGYLPEAMINFLATLGWNDGTDQEIYSIEELINKFALNKVQRSGAHFDEHRLEWMNGDYIRQKSLTELYELAEGFWPASAKEFSDDYKKQVLSLVKERLKYLAELPKLTDFFFEDLPVNLSLIDGNKQLNALGRTGQRQLLELSLHKLESSDFSKEQLTEALNKLLGETKQKPGVLFSLIRIATTWAPASPELAPSLSVLGKSKTLDRLKKSVEVIQ